MSTVLHIVLCLCYKIFIVCTIDSKWLVGCILFLSHNSINKQFTVNVNDYRAQSQIKFSLQSRTLALTYKKSIGTNPTKTPKRL